VESFEDRACIATGKVVHYSPEDTAFNSNAGMGCNGGNTAWNWFKSTGVVTGGDYTDIGSGDTCLPYSLAPCAHHVPPSAKYPACPGEGPSPVPGRKCSESGYSGAYGSDKLKAQSAFSVRGVSQIQTEIMTNGPLYVSFTVYDDFPTYKSGVYHATSHNVLGGHAVENVGWGSLDGQAYWRIKNSWNEQWGDGGHFKIVRGTNECGIEGGVSGGLISGSPAPAPTPTPPGPAPAGGSHYEKPPCSDDELQVDVTYASGATVGSVCAPECDMSGQCPQDVPEGAAAMPLCALQDSDTGKQYCALSCYLDSGCPSEASCAMIGGIFGVCLYPESATNGHKFVVANAATV
jgi:cathepsin B